jgi:L-ribulose-5-phosphate 3-epimerase
MERRTFLKNSAALGLVGFSPFVDLKFNQKKIGACDWSLGQMGKLEAFDVAKAIGLSGVQVSLGDVKNNLHLRQKEIQNQFLQKSKSTKVKITSLAIGELNNYPYKSDDQTDQWVYDSVDAAVAVDVDVILLAFFVKNDLRGDKKGIDTVIQKLKAVAPHAEKHGKILGIESYLTAEEHLDIMDKVGSDSIKVYYDFRNAKDAGNDIYKEITLLGNKNICEIHLKENRKYLGTGDIDWKKVKTAMDNIGYSSKKWMQLEWSLPDGVDYVIGHRQNNAFVKSL